MPSSFSRTNPGLLAGATRTSVYGPVPAGTTAIVFAGTFANVDTVNKADHTVTLETYDGTSVYTPVLTQIPIPWGSSSKCPKIVLMPGESLYATADSANMISVHLEVLVRT